MSGNKNTKIRKNIFHSEIKQRPVKSFFMVLVVKSYSKMFILFLMLR